MTTTRNTFPALFIALGLASAGFLIGQSLSQLHKVDRSVTVKGLAERNVRSNLANWQIRFSDNADDLPALYREIARSQKLVTDFLNNQGFASGTIQVQPVSVTDNEANGYSNNNAKQKRFRADSVISVNSTDVPRVETALQKTGAMVESGVILNSSTVRYFFTGLNEIKPQMLTDATNNARDAATAFAKNSQSQIGKIRSSSQGLFEITDADNSFDQTSPAKKVRIVTTVTYGLND